MLLKAIGLKFLRGIANLQGNNMHIYHRSKIEEFFDFDIFPLILSS